MGNPPSQLGRRRKSGQIGRFTQIRRSLNRWHQVQKPNRLGKGETHAMFKFKYKKTPRTTEVALSLSLTDLVVKVLREIRDWFGL